MSKRRDDFQYAAPKKRSRFTILAEYDDGNPEKDNEDEAPKGLSAEGK